MERIILKDVSKKFKIGFKKNQSALSRFISIFSGREPKKVIQVLKDISLVVKSGEILGVVGRNGSGKSTLLRIISEVYKKDDGDVKTNGKIISLISLNIGLQERLTMKDNIFLCCSLFNLGRKETKQRFDSIAKFAELEEFVNTKLYQFSEGMKQRLAFSIAIHCNPDILLLDEVFEVGDEDFRHKSAGKIEELTKNGASVLLVSHDLNMIKKHCIRVIWMQEGKIVKDGFTNEIIKEYAKK